MLPCFSYHQIPIPSLFEISSSCGEGVRALSVPTTVNKLDNVAEELLRQATRCENMSKNTVQLEIRGTKNSQIYRVVTFALSCTFWHRCFARLKLHLHEEEFFLRSKYLLNLSINSPHFMESEDSLPCSQEHATDP
jgi:hypothetical protein